MKYSSWIRHDTEIPAHQAGGIVLYTLHIMRRGVMIGVLDSRGGRSEAKAFWCPEISVTQGQRLARCLYKYHVGLEQVSDILSDQGIAFRITEGSIGAEESAFPAAS